jgi:hypothetical protein
LAPDWEFASPNALARHVGIDRVRILRWIRACKLPALNMASDDSPRALYKVARSDWEAFIASRKTTR